jgi:hypothetical protein
VILEIIKAVLYNRVLNKTAEMPIEGVRDYIDGIAGYYSQLIPELPHRDKRETTFDEWRGQRSELWMNGNEYLVRSQPGELLTPSVIN